MEDYTNFIRYLTAKKSVDDRALNQQLWDQLSALIKDTEKPLRILEIGGGIGTMIERLLERQVLQNAEYTLLDEQSENIAEARRRLPAWAEKHGFDAVWEKDALLLQKNARKLKITFLAEDIFTFLESQSASQKWDLIIAHAFLDLVDIPAALPQFFDLLRSGGHFYFTINFDGETIFEPQIPNDAQIMARYQHTMDTRLTNGKLSGDSRAGRHLFDHLKAAGGEILAAGSSDWVVFSGAGGYPADEAYFLHFILNTIQNALGGDADTDQDHLDAWASARHAQVRDGTLIYIAHQLDFLGSVQ
ncbi:MAG: methyltransferase [Anaerolineales bacterium]|uniref:Methyltransferase n=1 Tax=Candidatus Desulfolinea nitratireducens TaxID=2841698 RepID=A0A8J6NLD2_9CHLR|nr:methyltransferase [Candidatus Desulfolinea nitratireducens]MBL6960397.1 methyltransferase [Anaerolineales bacterium]